VGYRIAIFGHGSIGKRHLRIVRESLPDAEILVVRHSENSEVPKSADRVTSSIEEAVAFAPHMAVIANPAPFHLRSSSAMLEAGCHVLVEKPIATETDGIEELLVRAKALGLVFQVGYNLRFHPSLIEFRRLVQQDSVGTIHTVRCEIGHHLSAWRPVSDYRQGVSARRDLGGGVLLELSHEIDYLQWVFGEVVWVGAWTGHVSWLDVDVEDCAQLTLCHRSPSLEGEVVASLNMDFIRHDPTRYCTAIGSEGSLRWNGMSGTVECFRAGAGAWTETFRHDTGRDETYMAQWSHFLHCVKTGEKPIAGAEEGLSALRVVEAARLSAGRSGMRQNVSAST
jgi:predicted dehydrogenase